MTLAAGDAAGESVAFDHDDVEALARTALVLYVEWICDDVPLQLVGRVASNLASLVGACPAETRLFAGIVAGLVGRTQRPASA